MITPRQCVPSYERTRGKKRWRGLAMESNSTRKFKSKRSSCFHRYRLRRIKYPFFFFYFRTISSTNDPLLLNVRVYIYTIELPFHLDEHRNCESQGKFKRREFEFEQQFESGIARYSIPSLNRATNLAEPVD